MQTFKPSRYSTLGSVDKLGGDFALVNTQAKKNELTAAGTVATAAVAVPVLLGFLAIGPLVVMPWIIKAFKPEWSYGRRVAAGFGISMGIGALTGVARALGGSKTE